MNLSSPWDVLKPIAARMPSVVREHEVLRIAAVVHGKDKAKAAAAARREVLFWAQKRSGGRLPNHAWEFEEFDYLSGGRNSAVVRIENNETDIWAIRADDPDKTVPGRSWTTEVVVGLAADKPCQFSARLLASTSEDNLAIEPHTPGFVQQVAEKCILSRGPIDLSAEPWLIESEADAERLVELLIDPSRNLPVFVMTVPEDAEDPNVPILDATTLARAVLGIGQIVIVPAAHTWALTSRFGRQRSVFGGAVRAYLAGFSDDASPYSHRLVLREQISTVESARQCVRWMKSFAAAESIRRTRLGTDVLAFTAIRNASLQLSQARLEQEGASDTQKLEAATARIKVLEENLRSLGDSEAFLLDEHKQAEERAKSAEAQLSAATFRIQQLLDQIKKRGQIPDADIKLPSAWSEFGDWCDQQLIGRVVLAPQARSGVRNPEFDHLELAARCLLWLGNEYRDRRLEGGEGTLKDYVIEAGVKNAPCGADEFRVSWQGQTHIADWHIKNGGNTRDPRRCLRIYYFWDASTQQVVIADMPAHRRTSAT
ncbi:hypothetical protein ACE10W_37290 [Bradyrhizobium sp. B025]|uniref:hypothetical protein n=1 Tax=Bradyrhizobium sp. B025 TaxID=3344829 RepID=UPI0035D51338